jgi:hypothetical protein
MGRPSTFAQDIADAICLRLAEGETLRQICRDDGMPPESTVRQWVIDQAEFAAQYAKARDLGLDAMADALFEIADDGTNDTTVDEDGNVFTNHDVIARSRLRVDTRKWYLSKLAPKRYGDKLVMQGDAENPVHVAGTLTVNFVKPGAAG